MKSWNFPFNRDESMLLLGIMTDLFPKKKKKKSNDLFIVGLLMNLTLHNTIFCC